MSMDLENVDTAIFSCMSSICVGPVSPARPPSLSEQSLSGLPAICELHVCFVHTDTALFVCVCARVLQMANLMYNF